MGSLLVKATPRDLLARILEESALVAEVRALPAPLLAKLIDHVGLEDAGEIVELATVTQIERVFDEDLWRSQAPGEDEAFDEARFITWLEILLEAGDVRAGRRLAELSEDVITLAFHRLVVVVDVDALAADLSSHPHDEEEEELERAIEGALSHEIGSYLVFARQHDGWDAIVTAIVALDEVDHHACVRLLDRCAALAEREIEAADGGLHDVLTAEESFTADVAGERADRRAREGFVAPSDARSFLALARKESLEEIADAPRDPVTRAYFRELDRSGHAAPSAASDSPSQAPRLLRVLQEAGVLGSAQSTSSTKSKSKSKKKPKALPSATSSLTTQSVLSAALEALSLSDPALYGERMEELAFLVNVLVSGGASLEGRAFRPAEAAEAVLFVANAGLEALAHSTNEAPEILIAAQGVVAPFRAGVHQGALESFATPKLSAPRPRVTSRQAAYQTRYVYGACISNQR